MRGTLARQVGRTAKQNLRGCILLVWPGMNLICRRDLVINRLSSLGQCLGGISQE
jgi:hypothetical protein